MDDALAAAVNKWHDLSCFAGSAFDEMVGLMPEGKFDVSQECREWFQVHIDALEAELKLLRFIVKEIE